MNMIIIGFLTLFGSFVLSFVIAPFCSMFDPTYTLILYVLSGMLIGITLLISGKIAYNQSTGSIKSMFKRKFKR